MTARLNILEFLSATIRGKAKNPFINFKSFLSKYHWWIIITETVLLACLLWAKGALIYKFFNDAPSYIQFPFSSLSTVLGNARTIGLPLALKLYGLLFDDYRLWPWFQMLFYFISVFYFYWALLRFGFNKIISIIVVSHLIFERTICEQFSCIMPEALACSFLNFTLGSLLWTFQKGGWKSYLALGFFTFALYLTRPNFVVVAALVPLWAIAISFIFNGDGFKFRRVRNIFIRYASITVIPALLFCLLRLVVVGQFGVVSFAGAGLSGHATYYLNENNIKDLSGESRIIAEGILRRKRKLSFPYNITPFDKSPIPGRSKYSLQNDSHGTNCMTSMLVVIKYKTGVEPFDDPAKNIEAWRHVQTLSGFFTIYNAEIDQLLMRYAKDIIKLEQKQYLFWIVGGIYEGIKAYIKAIFSKRWFWILFLIMLLIARLLFFRRGHWVELESGRWYREVWIITIFGLSLFLVGVPLVVMFSCIDPRYLYTLSIYFFPVTALWILPPGYLNDKR